MIRKIKEFYDAYENLFSRLALFVGFAVDNLTLRRVDFLAENIVFLSYIFISAFSLLALNYLEGKHDLRKKESYHFFAFLLLQFAVGGLFSGFLVFYGRGSSFEASFPFLLLLGFLMLANEFLKTKYKARIFQLIVFYISIFAFLIFALPVIFKNISSAVFLLSGILSLVFITLFGRLLFFVVKNVNEKERLHASIAIWSSFALINIMYVFGFIPPLPLYVKDTGVYHNFERVGESYVGFEEKRSLEDILSFKKVFTPLQTSDIPYVFTSVYSPLNLNTKIIHDWQYKDSEEGWISKAKIETTLVGGREAGYRIYSFYTTPLPGHWRVDTKTGAGKVLGRIRFDIAESGSVPQLIKVVK